MKTLFKLLFYLVSTVFYVGVQAQEPVVDSTKYKICIERGHVMGGMCETTLMYCEPYLEETDSTTIKVYPGCNWITCNCQRCNKEIVEKERDQRVVIWRKEE